MEVSTSIGTVIELRYYESIRESTIRMSVSFVDTGNSVKDKSVLEGLPLVGTEKDCD